MLLWSKASVRERTLVTCTSRRLRHPLRPCPRSIRLAGARRSCPASWPRALFMGKSRLGSLIPPPANRVNGSSAGSTRFFFVFVYSDWYSHDTLAPNRLLRCPLEMPTLHQAACVEVCGLLPPLFYVYTVARCTQLLPTPQGMPLTTSHAPLDSAHAVDRPLSIVLQSAKEVNSFMAVDMRFG